MKFKILVLSETLERSKRLLNQFYTCNQVPFSRRDQIYQEMNREGRLTLSDGTILYARSISQRPDRFRAICFNQVFTDLDFRDIPEELRIHIDLDLMKSEIPEEFQWTYLDPEWFWCSNK